MGGVVVLGFIVAVVLAGGIAGVIDVRRQRGVPIRVRVAELREALRQAEPGEEVRIRASASWCLSVEMIIEVTADEGFRFCRDTTMSLNQRNYKAMVFVASATGERDG